MRLFPCFVYNKVVHKDLSSYSPCAHEQSHAIKTPSAIYCSGQIPCDVEGNLVEGTMQEKTAACIKNLKAVLTTAGSGIEKVVKVNIFITDMANFAVSLLSFCRRQDS